MNLRINTDDAVVEVDDEGGTRVVPFSDPEAFALVSDAWIRIGWDVKYVYGFTWLGRPIIQLPEDIVRLQEAVYASRPDIVIETGVAHGGSLVLFASVCAALGHGRVIGVDVDIRPHNRRALETHPLFSRITLIEGSSTDDATFARVRDAAADAERVFVMLDSNHAKDHVLKELRLYAPLVSVGSYVLVADGVMAQVAGGPRTSPDWTWNNPSSAIEDFLDENEDFIRETPQPLFNEGSVNAAVTYSPQGWLRRVR